MYADLIVVVIFCPDSDVDGLSHSGFIIDGF